MSDTLHKTPSETRAATAAALSPLVERLLMRDDCRLLQAGDDPQRLAGQGPVALFFSGDPRLYPEVNDLAVVLPELLQAFAGRFSVALVAPALAQTLKDVYQVSVWPSLVFLQRDGYLGRIDKMHDWSAFLGLIDDMLQRQPGRNPGVGVPVVPG